MIGFMDSPYSMKCADLAMFMENVPVVEYFCLNIHMNDPMVITSSDTMLETLSFKPYRSKVERRVIPFMPAPDEEQSIEIKTPWGTMLTAKSGDFLISELDKP